MTRDDGDATQLAALFKNAVVGVVKSRRVEMKNQLHYIPFVTPRRTHARARAMAPSPPPSGGGGVGKTKSYLDDLMSGSVNFMDVQRAKTSSAMRSSPSSTTATARGTTKSHGLRGGRDDSARTTTTSSEFTANPSTTTPYGGPSSTSSSIQEDDLEAFFKDARTTTKVTSVKDRERAGGGTKVTDDVFGDLDAFASGTGGATAGRSGNASRAPRRETAVPKTTSGSDLDDLFTAGARGGATGDKTTGSGEHARGASGGSDLFDLLSPMSRSASEFGASRPQSPGMERGASLMAHDTDGDGLIDGLDEILGGVNIASSPKRSSAPDGGKVVSSSSHSRSASLTNASDLLDELTSSPEAPVGLARFRSTTSVESAKSQEAPKPPSVKVECKPKEAPARPQPSTSNSVDDLDDFFSAGASKTPAKPSSTTASSIDPIEAMFTVSSENVQAAVPTGGVVDELFGSMETSATPSKSKTSSFVYTPEDDEEIDPNEPPERAALRKARHERNRQRIEAALAEKRARENAARAEQAERQMLKDLIGADIDAWQKKNQNNIRTMLANLGDVLWEGHRYKNPDMASLMQPTGVKKSYHRALVIIHPDKVSQAGGSMSQRYIADKVFDIVKVAYKEFEAKELK